MRNVQVVAVEPWRVELQTEELDAGSIGPHELLVRKRYTLISAGTELACISGNEFWFKLPGVPGYAAISEVIGKGAEVHDFEVGDLVFHYGKHSFYEVISHGGGEHRSGAPLVVKVPEEIDPLPGDLCPHGDHRHHGSPCLPHRTRRWVAVTGLGLVGNLAAQLAALQGARVIGIDISRGRLELAKTCGIEQVVSPNEVAVVEHVKMLTDGIGVSTYIEATGLSKVLIENLPIVARYGEVILLGSPRAPYETNVTDMLNYIHLISKGSLTFYGAHEWRYPVMADPFVKHSIERNTRIVFDLIQRGKLVVEPLLSHVFHPQDAQAAYDGLRTKTDEYYGVVFDWTRVEVV